MKVLCVIIVAAMVSCSPSKKDLMETTLIIDGKSFSIDLDKPNDISLAVQNNAGVGAWYIDQPKITHVEVDGYVGKVSLAVAQISMMCFLIRTVMERIRNVLVILPKNSTA